VLNGESGEEEDGLGCRKLVPEVRRVMLKRVISDFQRRDGLDGRARVTTEGESNVHSSMKRDDIAHLWIYFNDVLVDNHMCGS